MTTENIPRNQDDDKTAQPARAEQEAQSRADAFDGLKDKKPEDLTPEELRLMADTMPGDGPGD